MCRVLGVAARRARAVQATPAHLPLTGSTVSKPPGMYWFNIHCAIYSVQEPKQITHVVRACTCIHAVIIMLDESVTKCTMSINYYPKHAMYISHCYTEKNFIHPATMLQKYKRKV